MNAQISLTVKNYFTLSVEIKDTSCEKMVLFLNSVSLSMNESMDEFNKFHKQNARESETILTELTDHLLRVYKL